MGQIGVLLTLHDYVAALRRNWAIVLVLAIVGGTGGFLWTQSQPDQYRSQASVIVIPTRGENVSELVQGSNYVQNLVQTYTQLAMSPFVLRPVIDTLDLDTSPAALANRMSVEVPLDTTVIRISVSGTDPLAARTIANGVASELADAVGEISPRGADGVAAVRIETISPAEVPLSPYAPNPRQSGIIGAGIGLLLGLAFAVLRRLLASRLTAPGDIRDITDVPVLGEVHSATSGRSLPATVRVDPGGAVSESLRNVAASLRFANPDGESTAILVTSANAGDGKSSISVSLALVLAEAGHRVVLIDADLRRASVAKLTQLEGAVGLTSVLLNESTLEAALQEWGSGDVRVLTSGSLPPNPTQLLTSGQFEQIMTSARASFDYVIIDSPPVLAVSDPRWIAPLTDGVIVVARARRTRRESLIHALRALESTQTDVFGIILNGTKHDSRSPYYETEAASAERRSQGLGSAIQRLLRRKRTSEAT